LIVAIAQVSHKNRRIRLACRRAAGLNHKSPVAIGTMLD
jgi:hypothetical protein